MMLEIFEKCEEERKLNFEIYFHVLHLFLLVNTPPLLAIPTTKRN